MWQVRSLPRDGVYVRHMYNPDWSRLGIRVNLMNLVRDPVSRMASWFYFIRSPAAKNSLGLYTREYRSSHDTAWHQVTRHQTQDTVSSRRRLTGAFSLETLSAKLVGIEAKCSSPISVGGYHVPVHFKTLHASCPQVEHIHRYGPGCSDPSSVTALQRAKEAVEKHYAVVRLHSTAILLYESANHLKLLCSAGWAGGEAEHLPGGDGEAPAQVTLESIG